MNDIIVILIILVILAAAISKIVIAKRRGDKCIGCPYGQKAINECKCEYKCDNNEAKIPPTS